MEAELESHFIDTKEIVDDVTFYVGLRYSKYLSLKQENNENAAIFNQRQTERIFGSIDPRLLRIRLRHAVRTNATAFE